MDESRQSGWWARNWGCLVPIGVFAAVVLFVIGTGWPPGPPEQGRKKETIITQKMLLGAIDAYRKTTGAVPDVAYEPDSSDPNKSDPARQMALLVAELRGKDPDDPVYKATRPFLGHDPEPITHDAYGNAMLYLKDGGVGGKPVIVSAGADGKFGYETAYTTNPDLKKKYQKDNIRSDMN